MRVCWNMSYQFIEYSIRACICIYIYMRSLGTVFQPQILDSSCPYMRALFDRNWSWTWRLWPIFWPTNWRKCPLRISKCRTADGICWWWLTTTKGVWFLGKCAPQLKMAKRWKIQQNLRRLGWLKPTWQVAGRLGVCHWLNFRCWCVLLKN